MSGGQGVKAGVGYLWDWPKLYGMFRARLLAQARVKYPGLSEEDREDAFQAVAVDFEARPIVIPRDPEAYFAASFWNACGRIAAGSKGRQTLETIPEPSHDPTQSFEAARRAEQLLARLPAGCRDVITERLLLGRTTRETAELLRITPGWAKVKLSRCLDLLSA